MLESSLENHQSSSKMSSKTTRGGDAMSPWRTEVRRFCDTTSVKGVPKLMRARGPIRRTLWTSCVLLGAAMATYQSYILLKVYCDFETSTSVEFTNRRASFPDVTVCKTNPPPQINVGNFTFDDYLNKVEQIMKRGDTAQAQQIRYLQGHHGYYQNVLVEDNHVQDALQDFVLNCTYVLWNEEMEACNTAKQWYALTEHVITPFRQDQLERHRTPAVEAFQAKVTSARSCVEQCNAQLKGRWRWRFLTPAYPACVTFQVIDTPKSGRLRTLSLILYLNNFESGDVTSFDIYPLVSYSTGARVFLAYPGHFPDLGRVVLAPPGRETIIQFNEVQRTRADWPYSNCERNGHYHHQQCMDECIQNCSITECRCLDLTIPTTSEQRSRHKFCGYLHNNYTVKDLVTNLTCRRDYGNPTAYAKCEAQCPPECHTTTYHHRQMSAPWPHHSRHVAFHRDLIQNTSYAEKFKRYLSNQTDTSEETLISDNFLKVMVSFEFSDVMEYKDMPMTSPSALTGSLGAVLNLWSGVTFVTLVEVIDLLYSLCTANWQSKQDRHSANNSNQDPQQTVNLTMNDL